MTDCRHAFITGASKGVGRAIALRLAGRGTAVTAAARSVKDLSAVADEGGGNVTPVVLDITDPAAVAAAVEQAEARAPIDLLINNAAAFQMRDFCEQDPAWIDRILDTNLKGLLYVTRQVAPRMVERGRGRIINIASVAGTHGIPQQAVYCASKHGVVGFGDALAQELLPHDVLVTTLCPGGIDTPLWRDGDSRYPGDLDRTMKVEELAELVEFLISQTSRTLYKKLVFFPTNEWH